MGTKINSNYSDLLTFTRASKGHALRPVSYGTELVTNGNFSTDSDWTLNSASISDGVLNFTDSGTFSRARQGDGSVLTVGKLYAVSFEIKSVVTAGTVRLRLGGNSSTAILISASVGVHTGVFVCEAPVNTAQIETTATNTFTGTIDNVSVKEVLFDQPDGTLTLFEHPDNVPRVEWDADRNRLGLLVEEFRTNTVVYSEDLSNTSEWDANGVLDPVLSTVRPPTNNGFAYKVIEDTSNGGHLFSPKVSITSGNTYTFSVFAKAAERSILRVGAISTYFGSNTAAFFDLSDGSLGTVQNNASASIEDFGNGWYRCSWTADAINTSTGFDRVFLGPSSADNTFSYQGDGSSGIYLWGAQFEEGSFPTSYIKNEGTASGKDRSADVASIPVADFGYNADEGTLFAELRAEDTSSTTGHTFYSLKKDTSNYVRLDRYSAGFALRVRDGGTYSVQAQIPGGEPNTTDLHKVSAAYKANDFAYVYNGGTVGTDTSGTVPDGITTLHLSEGDFNGHIKKLMYIPRRVTNAQLISLTE